MTRPLEDELSTIGDVKELTSTSTEGSSTVVAEFETTVDLEDALARVREKVDLARPELPADAEDPVIVEFNFSEVPILQVNLSGEYGLVRLKEIAEDLQDRLEAVPEILRVDVRGGLEREVQVNVDLQKLKYYGLAHRRGVRRSVHHRGPGHHERLGPTHLRAGRGLGGLRVRREGELRPPGRDGRGHPGRHQALGPQHHRDLQFR